MEYYVAESYKNYELIGAPYEKSGKMYTKARANCERCVKGVFVSRIENGQPVPHPAYGGVCLRCGGAGYITKEIRLYTEKEKAATERAKKRAAERKEAEKVANAERKRAKWLEKEGFTLDGVTTIYIGSNSFDIKDQLKAEGWKYSPMFGWRIAATNIEKYGVENVIEVSVKDLASFNLYGEGFWLDTAKNFVEQIRNSRKQPSKSKWLGVEKSRLKNIPVVVKSIHGTDTRFGWVNIITFLNEDNILTWFTSTEVKCAVGEVYLLAGTVKEHKEYKDEKQTIISRVKLTLEEN